MSLELSFPGVREYSVLIHMRDNFATPIFPLAFHGIQTVSLVVEQTHLIATPQVAGGR